MHQFTAGFLSGVLGTIVGHPFDSIKVASQVNQSNGFFHNCRWIYGEYGFMGFQKGLMSPLVSRSLIKGSLFSSYGYSNTFLESYLTPYTRMFVSGMFAGAVSSLFCSPMELIKISKQRDHSILQLINEHGAKILMKGLTQTFIREIPFNGIYFPLYHYLKDRVPMAGGLTGVITWTLVYPLDVIKTLHQVPNNTVSVTQLWSQRGIKGFYNGLSATLVRAFPVHL